MVREVTLESIRNRIKIDRHLSSGHPDKKELLEKRLAADRELMARYIMQDARA